MRPQTFQELVRRRVLIVVLLPWKYAARAQIIFSYCCEIVTESAEKQKCLHISVVRSHLEADVYLFSCDFFNDVAASSGYTVYRGMVHG